MKSIGLLSLVTLAYGQYNFPCSYTGGPNGRYTLNLTSVSGYHLEYESPASFFYYYTPCANGEHCVQGNADFRANAVQYQPGANKCQHYLSVEHHQQPQYFFGGASWLFNFQDGELCAQTQQPRQTNIWYLCDENLKGGAYMYDVDEFQVCRYAITIRSPLACVPENSHNANCQWRYHNYQTNMTYYLDLSSQNHTVLHGDVSRNGYEMYYSPCRNGIHCYQQTGQTPVMSIVENRVTQTCDHYLSEWQEGRVQPILHLDANDQTNTHWSFHYWLSEKCASSGAQGEETIRWYCDPDVNSSSVINATYDGDCRWEFNVASQYACPGNSLYHTFHGEQLPPKARHWKDHF